MKKALLFLLAGLCYFASSGQTQLEAVLDQGIGLLKANNYAEAIPVFTSIISKATDKKLKKSAYVYRAYAYKATAESEAAVKDLDTAIMLDPHDYGSFIDRGQAKGALRDYHGAEKDFNTVLKNSNSQEQKLKAFYWLGLSAYSQTHFAQAIKYYTNCIAIDSTDAEFYFNRALAKGMLLPTNLQGSIEDYDRAIRLKPDYAAAYANRGVAKINQFTTKGVIQPSSEQTMDACSDLKTAKSLGDNTVDDMIFVYCGKK